MQRRSRIYYTETQCALMWDRWKKGETLQQIAKLFDRPHTSIRGVLAERGGIRPPERQLSRLALSLSHETIYRGLFIQTRGALKKEHGQIADAIAIS
jgi:hypothetical protein